MGALMSNLLSSGWNPPRSSAASAPDVDYPDAARDRLHAIEDVSPWFLVRNRVIDSLLARCGWPEALVEVGAGNGTVAAHMQAKGMDVIAIEPGAAGAANCRRRGLVTMNESLGALHFPDESLPCIGFFDVFEHLDDPGPVVREAYRTLCSDGILAVTVPALPLLWSQADEFAGHHRRYTVASLDALLAPVGFHREACSYFFALGVPFSLVQRAIPFRLGRRRSPQEMIDDSVNELNPRGRAIPTLIRWAGFLESQLIARRIRLPAGTSLGAIYRKRAGGAVAPTPGSSNDHR